MSEDKDMFDSIYDLSFEMTMEKPRKRPNVWVCANPKCPCPCWATSTDMSETPGASDCLGLGSSDYFYVQVKPMTGRCVRKTYEDDVIDVEPEFKLLEG